METTNAKKMPTATAGASKIIKQYHTSTSLPPNDQRRRGEDTTTRPVHPATAMITTKAATTTMTKHPKMRPGQDQAVIATSNKKRKLENAGSAMSNIPAVAKKARTERPTLPAATTSTTNDQRLIKKLTVSLVSNYNQINAAYRAEKNAKQKKHHYTFKKGDELLSGRYEMMGQIGEGGFGRVLRAYDIKSKRDVAIKVIQSGFEFTMQARSEIELLKHLQVKDPNNKSRVVRLLNTFKHRNHQCLVFEMLSDNLFQFLEKTDYRGLTLDGIQNLARQMLQTLAFFRRKDVGVIHGDLKLENLVLRHPNNINTVKVIDFGLSRRTTGNRSSIIPSRCYRSPEVILGLPYDAAIDVWSLGCILAEMHTGKLLFYCLEDSHQMQKIVEVLGMVPNNMLEKSKDEVKYQYFEKRKTVAVGGAKDQWVLKQIKPSSSTPGASSPTTVAGPNNASISSDPIASLMAKIKPPAGHYLRSPQDGSSTDKNYEHFVDLLYKMLAYNPEERIKPSEALFHPFLF